MSFFFGDIFLLVLALILAITVFAFLYRERRRSGIAKNMLETMTGVEPAPVTKLLKDAVPEVSPVYRLLESINLGNRTERFVRQAGLNWTPITLLLASAAAAVPGAIAGILFPFIIDATVTSVTLGVAAAWLPYMYVRRLRRKRLEALEEHFPDALDFLSRSVRAGHAFLISLSMVSEHVAEPLATELRTLFNEVNLGAPLDKALENLTTRVPLLDFRFFTSSVLLQRQTGGNISEILTRLAHVIRERFRLKGEVKAASAHGRLTAGVLTALPILTALALMGVAPGYLQGMARDSDGRYLLLGAGMALFIGNFFIRRIIKIEV